MIYSVRVFELLGPGGAYGGFLQAHLSLLFFQVKQSLFDVSAAQGTSTAQNGRGFSVKLGNLRLIQSKRHGPRGAFQVVIARNDTLLRDTQVIVDITQMSHLLPVAEYLHFFTIMEVQFLHDFQLLSIVMNLGVPLAVLHRMISRTST